MTIVLAALKLVLSAGTPAEPSAVAPVTPCSEAIAFWWDAKAFHAGDKAFVWEELGTVPTNGATFKVRYGTIDRRPADISCTIDLSRPRFEVGSFGPIGDSDVKTCVRVHATKDGEMRSVFGAQGQTPDYMNYTKSFPVKRGGVGEIEIAGRGSASGVVWYELYDTDGTLVCSSSGTYRAPGLKFDYQYVWTDAAKKRLHLVTMNWTDGEPGDYALRLTAKDLKTDTLGSWTKTVALRKAWGEETYEFDVADLPEGFYKMHVDYLDAAGKVVRSDFFRYMKPAEKMPWEGTTLGAEDTVPPPWTKPAFGEDGTFRCWNREIRFGGKGLVTSILNGGRETLTEPVAVLLDGKPLAFAVELVRKRVSSAVYRLKAKGADISVLAECDFDGYVRFRLRYGKGVKDLAFRIGVRRDALVAFDDSTQAGKKLLIGGETFDFDLDLSQKQWWWLAGKRGLMGGVLNLHDFHLKDLARGCHVAATADAVAVTTRFVDCEQTADAQRTVQFFLEPTPVKPKDYSFASADMSKLVLWTGYLCEYYETKYPGFGVPELLKRYGDRIKNGDRVFTYCATKGVSPESPFWGWYGMDWNQNGISYYAHEVPLSGKKRVTNNWAYGCPNSKSFFEQKLWGVNWYLNEAIPETKDLYFDLAPAGRCCRNAQHGCAWKDDFGRTMYDASLQSVRELHKRAYRLVKAKNADGTMYGHTAESHTPADVFFGLICMGESLCHDVYLHGNTYYEVFTPELMQTMFVPSSIENTVVVNAQFGRALHCFADEKTRKNYPWNSPEVRRAIRHFIAYMKMHDISIELGEHDYYSVTEKAYCKLGERRTHDAYYLDGASVTLSAPGPRQLWSYDDNGQESILVVLNDTDKPVRQTVQVKGLAKKGMDILNKASYDFTSGSCTFDLGPREAKLIRFGGEG